LCLMALLTVFALTARKSWGSLSSSHFKMHFNPHLNRHFETLKIVIYEYAPRKISTSLPRNTKCYTTHEQHMSLFRAPGSSVAAAAGCVRSGPRAPRTGGLPLPRAVAAGQVKGTARSLPPGSRSLSPVFSTHIDIM